jgi:protocatechuate 3,4-dioxygenase beta subunit
MHIAAPRVVEMVAAVLWMVAGAAAAEVAAPPKEAPAAKLAVLTGTLRDQDGRPVAGATVALYGGLATRWKQQEAVTDANGIYRFDPLESGAYMMNDDGSFRAFYVGMRLEHPTHISADGNSWWDVEVPGTAGHVEVKDFVMTPGGFVRGAILDPVSGGGARLDLRVYCETEGRHFLDYVTTDEAGAFLTKPLAPGLYKVDANEPKLNYPVLGEVVVAAGKETQFTARFITASDAPALTGRVVDENGRPMAGVRVILYRDPAQREPGQSAETNADGEYRFAPVQTGNFLDEKRGQAVGFVTTLVIHHDSHTSADGASSWSVVLPLKAGHVETRDFVLIPGGTATGLIRDPKTGEPLRHVRVRLVSVEGAEPRVVARTVTNSAGRFRASAVFPGRYLVQLDDAPRDWPTLGEVVVAAGVEADVTLNSP